MSSKLGELRRSGRDKFAFVARMPWVFHQNEIAASDVKVQIVVLWDNATTQALQAPPSTPPKQHHNQIDAKTIPTTGISPQV